jgi:hypothetical protein
MRHSRGAMFCTFTCMVFTWIKWEFQSDKMSDINSNKIDNTSLLNITAHFHCTKEFVKIFIQKVKY